MMRRTLQTTQTGSTASRWFFVLLFLVIACTVSTQWCRADATVSASLDATRFSIDESAALTVTVNGSRSADIQLPVVAGLNVEGPGKSTQIQVINGSFSSSVTFRYLVAAAQPGTYTIPPISVSVDGSTLKTEPLTFEVIPAGNASASGPGTAAPPGASEAGESGKLAFLRISELKDTCWTGEVLPVQIKAYFRQGIKIRLNTLPVLKGDDFVMPQLDQKPRLTEETVNGSTYSVLTWESSLSAVKEGRHTLGFELEATALLPQRNNRFPGFDEDLFTNDPFQNIFGGFKSKAIKITSGPISIEAKQLPASNQASKFSGAIGHFNLSVGAKPTTVDVGDPITLTMVVSGTGNFDRVEAPTFPEDPKWKSYPPTAEFHQGSSPTQGTKQFEQAIMVKDDRVTEIPPVSFVYFDPATEHYVTLTSGPLPLTVNSSGSKAAVTAQAAPASSGTAAPTVAPEHPGIAGLAPINLHLGSLQQTIVPLYARTWFDVLVILCALLLLTVLLWKIRRSYLRNNPQVLRKKATSELLAGNLALVKEAADHNDSRQYLAVCRKAIQTLLGHHWQIEPSAITLADLQARLPASSGLITIFAAAEQGAYANHTLSPAQIRQYAEQIEQELSELL